MDSINSFLMWWFKSLGWASTNHLFILAGVNFPIKFAARLLPIPPITEARLLPTHPITVITAGLVIPIAIHANDVETRKPAKCGTSFFIIFIAKYPLQNHPAKVQNFFIVQLFFCENL